jgi:hypothetical protein
MPTKIKKRWPGSASMRNLPSLWPIGSLRPCVIWWNRRCPSNPVCLSWFSPLIPCAHNEDSPIRPTFHMMDIATISLGREMPFLIKSKWTFGGTPKAARGTHAAPQKQRLRKCVYARKLEQVVFSPASQSKKMGRPMWPPLEPRSYSAIRTGRLPYPYEAVLLPA